jgi:hypothetical protein
MGEVLPIADADLAEGWADVVLDGAPVGVERGW